MTTTNCLQYFNGLSFSLPSGGSLLKCNTYSLSDPNLPIVSVQGTQCLEWFVSFHLGSPSQFQVHGFPDVVTCPTLGLCIFSLEGSSLDFPITVLSNLNSESPSHGGLS